MEELETSSLATQHSLLLEERLRGAVHGPTSFSGLFSSTANRVNEYASFLAPDEDAEPGALARPLQRWVSNIDRIMPAGVQIEPRRLEIGMPPPARRAAAAAPPPTQAQQQLAQQQQQRRQQAEPPAAKHPRLSGQFAGEPAPPGEQQAAPPPAPAPQPIAQAAPVPGNPLKIRLKFARGSSVPRGSPDKPISAEAAAALVQSARQLGAGLHPPLSPIPAGWAEVVSCTTPLRPSLAAAIAQGAGSGGSSMHSPFESVSADECGQRSGGAAGAPVAGAAPAGTLGPAVEPARQLAQQAGLQEQARTGRVSGPAEDGQQREQQPAQPPRQQEQQQQQQPSAPRQPPPVAAAAGAKRPAPPALPSDAAAQAPGHASKKQKTPAAAGATGTACAVRNDMPAVPSDDSTAPSAVPTAGSHPVARAPNTGAMTAAPRQQQQKPGVVAPQQEQRERFAGPADEQRLASVQQPQQPAVPVWAAEALAGRSDDSRLGVLAALLPPALQQAAGGGLPGSRVVQSLQEEGKKLKKFAEKKMRDGRPTHVSSMFLCQSCVKFLTVAAIMEGHPAKYSRESTSSMYSQTASLLDNCAHNSGRAEGPATITAAISLLAQRLAAVARLRAAYCLRTEGVQQAAAFRAALEKASGETYQRPSPTDSNTSTSISVPLDAPAKPAGAAGVAAARSSTPTGGRSRAAAGAKAASAPSEALVGLPKAVLERQLVAAQHSQAVVTALSAFSKSSERLREFMGQAAEQSNVQGLKVAAATLLLSADAGMGPATAMLAFAKDALDAVMQMQ